MNWTSLRHAVRNRCGGQIALYSGKNLTGKMRAEFVVGVATEPGAEILVGDAGCEILAQ
jgi:hypothetical protein